jgi:class 3 adenylate cyclase/tetratricopeptide (TPR) repeat protein
MQAREGRLDIAAWLKDRLERYTQTLAENDVDDQLLRRLTSDDLKDLGFASLGHRMKLLDAIAALDAAGVTGSAPVGPEPSGNPLPQRQAERRQLTVMFVDLVGSTALSARLDPEEMREILRAYQNTVSGEISRLEGFTAKLMGDGVLAYFGWPRAYEDSAERAVRAGLAVAAAVARLPAVGSESLAARVGIATGLVVVGDLVGEGAAQERAVVGDTPNLAARLQALAEPGVVVIAEATRRLLGELFELRDLGARTLKGLAGPTSAFAVLGERAQESRFAARHGSRVAPMVGRDQELAFLLERWRQAGGGEGQAVLLTGEAGIGKSRVTEALVETIQAEPHFLLRYQCSPYNADSPLFAAIQHLGFAAGFATDDDTACRLDKLEALLARAGYDIREAAPLMAALVGLNGDTRYGALTLTPQQRRNRTLAALIDQLSGLAQRRPVLWVVEDAHWIDPTTLELIELALDRVQSARVMVLVTARPTFVPAFASHPVVTRLALNRLARAATQAIVLSVTGGRRLPDALLDEIAGRTDGVPLFVEEMTKAVIESGDLRQAADAYHLDGPLSALAIPTTLHDSLMARLDRLLPVKEVAQTASVIGRSFDHVTIVALAGLPEPELAEAMLKLVEAELVFRRGTPPDASYLFKHALVRDAAYESMLKAKRVALHARLLDVLEERSDAAPEVKAQHAEAAGLAEQALGYWEKAGGQALARPAYKEAITSFENAVRLCHSLGHEEQWKRRAQALQLQLGQALIANQGYSSPATLKAFERAIALADEIGDVSLQMPALFGQWAGHHIAATGSAELARRFALLADTQPETGPRLVALRMLALEAFLEGRYRDSLELARKSLESYDPELHRYLYQRFGHDPRAAAANYKAWNLWHLGFSDQATSTIDDNLSWAAEFNHPNTTGLSLCYGAAQLYIWLRRPDKVETIAREALQLSTEMSLGLWRAWALVQLGWALSQLGTGTGLHEIETGLDEARQIGARRLEPFHLGLAAQAYARVGRHAEATHKIDMAFEALAKGFHSSIVADMHCIRANLALQADDGDAKLAEADLRHALKIAQEKEALSLQLRAAREIACLMAKRGEKRQAADLLIPIYNRFVEGFETLDLLEAKALLNDLST